MTRVFHIIAGLMMAFYIAAALAEEPDRAAVAGQESALLLQLRPGMALISEKDCQQLTRHRPDASVAYKPGVDVRGHPVVPAELNGTNQALELPDIVSYNLLTTLDQNDPLALEGSVGRIALDLETGEMTANGRLLTPPEQRAILYRCQNSAAE